VKEAADLSAGAGGGTSLQLDVPIQRIDRDIKALNLHAIMHQTRTSNRTGGWPAGTPSTPNTSETQ
jgi:acyl-CoA dehydrogenase-like protein